METNIIKFKPFPEKDESQVSNKAVIEIDGIQLPTGSTSTSCFSTNGSTIDLSKNIIETGTETTVECWHEPDERVTYMKSTWKTQDDMVTVYLDATMVTGWWHVVFDLPKAVAPGYTFGGFCTVYEPSLEQKYKYEDFVYSGVKSSNATNETPITAIDFSHLTNFQRSGWNKDTNIKLSITYKYK